MPDHSGETVRPGSARFLAAAVPSSGRAAEAGSRGRGARMRGRRPLTPGFAGRTRRGTSLMLNMAPMIDMTFLLFSFVLVTSNFDRPEGVLASELPDQSGAPAVALPFSPIVVRLSWIGPGEDDVSVRIDRFAETPRGVGELTGLLQGVQSQPGFDKETPVVIVADVDVRWDHVVACWNAALRTGSTNVVFAEP